jgi:hypothetical protein
LTIRLAGPAVWIEWEEHSISIRQKVEGYATPNVNIDLADGTGKENRAMKLLTILDNEIVFLIKQ